MTQAIELTVTQKRPLTPSSVELTLAVPEELQTNFAFKAGQYLTLIQEIDHAEVRRSYSLIPSDGTTRRRRLAAGGAAAAAAAISVT